MTILSPYYKLGGYGYGNLKRRHNYVVIVNSSKGKKVAAKYYKTRAAANKRLYTICRRNDWTIIEVKQFTKHCYSYQCRDGQEIFVCRW